MPYMILQLKYVPQKIWHPEKLIGLLQEKNSAYTNSENLP